MRKKIKLDSLVIGMYIDELCGSWMDHPFFKTSFLLEDHEKLLVLRQSNIREVWIDTSKGLDTVSPVDGMTQEDVSRDIEGVLPQADTIENKPDVSVSLDQEMDRAIRLQNKAKRAVIAMFEEVRMGNALPIGEMSTLVDEINQSLSRNSSALLSLARLKTKDDYAYLHSVAVCALMIALGKQMGIEGATLKSLGMAGLLHDIGKIVVPDVVLNKPGRLTDAEFDLVKTHTAHGWEILNASSGVDDVVLDVCLHHHERVDGKGYPDKISGEALSLAARMGAVCDVYDAITSNRCYKVGWAPAEALRKMAEWQDGHFDKSVFQAFVKAVGIYPVGTLVKLKSGRFAVVIDQSKQSLLKPIVKVFFSSRSNTYITQEIMDLSQTHDAIACVEDEAKWGFELRKMIGVG